jgi:hypothetical protein
MSEETVRDVMYERMRGALEDWNSSLAEDKEAFQIALDELVEIAFSTCGISEKEQKEPWYF